MDQRAFGTEYLVDLEFPVYGGKGPVVSVGDPTSDDGPRGH